MPLSPVMPAAKPHRTAAAAGKVFAAAALALSGSAGVQSADAAALPDNLSLLYENDFGGTAAAGGTGGGVAVGIGDPSTVLVNPIGDDPGLFQPGTDGKTPGTGGLGGAATDGPAATSQLPPQWDNWRPGTQRRDAINDPRAVVIENGALTIKTWTETNAAGKQEHHSGMIATKGLAEQAYGYFEARIDFNDSPGQWSAFWMYQESIANQPSTTGATGVELDIMEHRLLDKNGNNIAGQGSSNTHWNGYEPGMHQGDYFHTGDLDLDEGFHTYGLLWTPDGYRFSIDGNETWTAPNTPVSGVEQYLLLSSEVEDGDWAGNIPAAGYGSFEDSQTSLVVDYVRVYGLNGTAVPEPATAGVVGLIGLAGLARRRRA